MSGVLGIVIRAIGSHLIQQTGFTRVRAQTGAVTLCATWVVGLTAAFPYVLVRAGDEARWRRIGWAIIAIFLLYMAMDDGSEFHERIGSSVKSLIQGEVPDTDTRQVGFFPSYTWQLVFLPIFAAFGLFILWFLNKELRVARDKLMVIAAIGLLVLAVVADFLEGLTMEHPLNLHAWIKETCDLNVYEVRHYSKSVEEFIEMLSMTLLWVVFLRHLVRMAPTIQMTFRSPERPHDPSDRKDAAVEHQDR